MPEGPIPISKCSSWIAVLIVVAGLGACAEPPDEEPVEPEVVNTSADDILLASAKVALPPTGIAPGDLPNPGTPGANMVQQYCVACHALPTPLAHSATDWPSVVRRMWLRMDRIDPKYAVAVPNDGERIATLNYLVDNALRVSGAALPPGPGREFFSATCSQCHALPDPRQHSAADWVAVVRRMMTHMGDLLGATLTQEEIGTISGYLRTVSGA